MSRTLQQFTESTTQRIAYGLTLVWVALVGLGLLDKSFLLVAAPLGFAAGIWMGRLTEAREVAKGKGVILGK